MMTRNYNMTEYPIFKAIVVFIACDTSLQEETYLLKTNTGCTLMKTTSGLMISHSTSLSSNIRCKPPFGLTLA